MDSLQSHKDLDWWSLFWNIVWGIWIRRNKWHFEKKKVTEFEVINKAVCLVNEFVQVKEVNERSQEESPMDSQWQPPEMGVIKVNSDAAIISPNAVGLGGVMRDHEGDVVASTCLQVEGCYGVEVMEAMAMRHALTITLESGFTRICLETDCLTLFTHLTKEKVTPTAFGMIINDIITLSKTCERCSFSFVRRSGNQVAHSLAKLCSHFVDFRVWMEEYPSDITELVLADLSRLIN